MSKTLIAAFVALFLLGSASASAQFKAQVPEESRIGDGSTQSESSSWSPFSWFNPENFHMTQSFSMSYMTMGGQGLSLGTYTNSMMYQFSDKLDARADLSLSYSPFNSFNTFGKKNDFSSLYLSRAELNYRPWKNVIMQVQFRQLPYSSYFYNSPFYNPW